MIKVKGGEPEDVKDAFNLIYLNAFLNKFVSQSFVMFETNFRARKGVEQLHAQLNFMIIEDLFMRFSIKNRKFLRLDFKSTTMMSERLKSKAM